jgi:hypothetical protein
VCCQEFTPRNENVNPENMHERFCLNCANFDEVNGIPVCARDHRPGRACGAFRRKEEEVEVAA